MLTQRVTYFIKTETELSLQPDHSDPRGHTAADSRAEMVKEALLDILDELKDDEFKRFQWYLRDDRIPEEFAIKKNKLQNASRCDTVDLMVQVFTVHMVVGVASDILEKMKRNDLVVKLEDRVNEEDAD